MPHFGSLFFFRSYRSEISLTLFKLKEEKNVELVENCTEINETNWQRITFMNTP